MEDITEALNSGDGEAPRAAIASGGDSDNKILRIIRSTQTKIQKKTDVITRRISGKANGGSASYSVASGRPRARKYNLLPADKLKAPVRSKDGRYLSAGGAGQPLVPINLSDDESDEEFNSLIMKQKDNQEICTQLMKDGYDLDLQSDDEDLDLIPPRPLDERCICCNYQITCAIL